MPMPEITYLYVTFGGGGGSFSGGIVDALHDMYTHSFRIGSYSSCFAVS